MGENIVPGVEGRRRRSGKEGGGRRRRQHSLHFLIYMRRIRGWCVKEEELELVMGCRSGGRSAPRGGKVEVEVRRWPSNGPMTDGGPALTKNDLFLLIQCADHSKCTILYK